jgi:hypothetical protein
MYRHTDARPRCLTGSSGESAHGVGPDRLLRCGVGLGDPRSNTVADCDHSTHDDRYILIGRSARQHLVEEMRAEYDFGAGVRGKYAARFSEGTNLVLLAPDVAAEFPTAATVNKALREVIKARSKHRSA